MALKRLAATGAWRVQRLCGHVEELEAVAAGLLCYESWTSRNLLHNARFAVEASIECGREGRVEDFL